MDILEKSDGEEVIRAIIDRILWMSRRQAMMERAMQNHERYKSDVLGKAELRNTKHEMKVPGAMVKGLLSTRLQRLIREARQGGRPLVPNRIKKFTAHARRYYATQRKPRVSLWDRTTGKGRLIEQTHANRRTIAGMMAGMRPRYNRAVRDGQDPFRLKSR
ncbi:MAG: hypothetical protein OXC95_02120 [Dehalococcoidia bacterium]|nr:hypothetical protein [Dehalococcoidia bacterium]